MNLIHGPILVSYLLIRFRDQLFAQYCTIFPNAVDRRHRDLQRTRGKYVVPGPNLVWSVDGHDKLEDFGIEIYNGIGGHAQYVPWLTVGISNRTAICVLQSNLAIAKFGATKSLI